MTSSCFRDRIFNVSIQLETSRESGRGLLRGICRYQAMHGRWRIKQQAPVADAVPAARTRNAPDRPDGIIMRDYRGCPAVLKKGIPVVFAAYLHKDIRGSHRIVSDDEAIARMAAAHLLERGFRHFAFVGYDGLYWSRQRRDSFSQAIVDAGSACTAFKQAHDLRLRTWRRERPVLANWLKTLPRPVGLMACDDERAGQVVDACAMAGLAVPEDIAIIGVDNDEFLCNLSHPSLSSVALGFEDAGYRAAELLNDLMAASTPQSLPSRILVSPIEVVMRRSSDTTAIDDPAVATALRFIRENSHRPIRIADILPQVTISRRNLIDRFRRTVGCTVSQYIRKARVARIEAMLLNTSDSVGEIAEILGFPSSDHIAAYFRSSKGLNPHVFRTRYRPDSQGR